jgi:hypothetical protein
VVLAKSIHCPEGEIHKGVIGVSAPLGPYLATRRSIDEFDHAIVRGTDNEGQDPPQVSTRHDVLGHVLVMSINGGPLLSEHKLALVVLALKHVEGLATSSRPTDVPLLPYKRKQSSSFVWKGLEVDYNVDADGGACFQSDPENIEAMLGRAGGGTNGRITRRSSTELGACGAVLHPGPAFWGTPQFVLTDWSVGALVVRAIRPTHLDQ